MVALPDLSKPRHGGDLRESESGRYLRPATADERDEYDRRKALGQPFMVADVAVACWVDPGDWELKVIDGSA